MKCPTCSRSKTPQHYLSRRESEVFALIAQGKSNKDAAQVLFVHEKTIKFHLTNIYKKLGITQRNQLVHGWFTRRFNDEQLHIVHKLLTTHAEALKEEKSRAILPVGQP